ncbi:hypothetical protein [Ureaplasma ceti]|uniref:Uncharacterized protein n=1 Tax=Ureaplasma ceti TaxID=3119530 RepID=A0ABP9U872_9BACT
MKLDRFNKPLHKAHKAFKPYYDAFIQYMNQEYALAPFSQILNTKIGNQIINFFHGFLYFYRVENFGDDFDINKLSKDNYFALLKGVTLFLLSTQNNYTKNIFGKTFIGSHNPNELVFDDKLNLESKDMLLRSTHIIYTISLIFNKFLINFIGDAKTIYELIYNYLAFVIVNNNIEPIKKRSLFAKKTDVDLDNRIEQIEITLEYFKNCQNILKKILPTSFNDLTFLINKNFKEMN